MTAAGAGRRGSLRQAENGTWFLIVDVGVGTDRRQTRRRGFATRKAAQAELTRILGALEQRTYVVPKRQTLAAFLTDVWLPAIEHTVKPGTFESYRRNVRLHVAERPIGRRPLQEVDPTELNALYAALLAGDDEHRALSPRSVTYLRRDDPAQGLPRRDPLAGPHPQPLRGCGPAPSLRPQGDADLVRRPASRLPRLRHTHATLALKAGIHPRIAQERLGHANVSITLDTYSHVDLDMQAAAARQVAALITAGAAAPPPSVP
jgi:hypothetical protein